MIASILTRIMPPKPRIGPRVVVRIRVGGSTFKLKGLEQ